MEQQHEFEFDLNLLTKFPKALVYGFEPEGDGSYIFSSIYHMICQFSDTLEAYLYAQDHILPIIEERGLSSIEDGQWITWIKELHRKIGRSLLDSLGMKSGEYALVPVFRWHHGANLQNEMSGYLAQSAADISANLDAFCMYLEKEYQQSHDEFCDVINIVQKVFNDSSFHQIQIVDPQTPNIFGVNKLIKLHEAYHAGKLTAEECVKINRVVKLSTPSENIASNMEKIIFNFTAELKLLDIADQRAMASFLAKYFYALTETHPFVNANGRTVTCFINIILKAAGYPAILLRHPGDKEDTTSLYSRAIASIDDSRDLLTELLFMRISNALIADYENEHLKSLVTLRVAMSNAYHDVHLKFPEFDIDSHWEELKENMPRVEEIESESSPLLLDGLKWVVSQIKQLQSRLTEQKAMAAIKFHNQELTKEQIKRVESKLHELSGQTIGWKAYKKGSIFLLENEDITQVNDIKSILDQSKACKASI